MTHLPQFCPSFLMKQDFSTEPWLAPTSGVLGSERLAPPSFLQMVPSSSSLALLTPALQEGWKGTHCSVGRASGSGDCTGVPILLSPSPVALAPCRGRGEATNRER